MNIVTNFESIPDLYSKRAPAENKIDNIPTTSFPFVIENVPADARYFHWAMTDDDAIEVCGFQWIHWSVANVSIKELNNDNGSIVIPENFSQVAPEMMSEVVQGKTSQASPWVDLTNPLVCERYNGPQPPNADHWYHLRVWATREPLERLKQGFWLDHLYAELRKNGANADLGASGDVVEANVLADTSILLLCRK